MGEVLESAFHGIALCGRAFAGRKQTAPQSLSGALGFPPQRSGLSSGGLDCPPQAAVSSSFKSRTPGGKRGWGAGAVFSFETKPDLCSALDCRRALAV